MIYHILNGDALLAQFPKQIPGERIIFRECLVDGPVKPTEGQQLWQLRESFIHQNYQANEERDYYTYAYQEILKIKSIPAESQIYCWFEEDLFCQVNLWFVLNYLKIYPAEVNLILPDPHAPYQFSAMGEKELMDAYQTKSKKLRPRERAVLGDLWLHFQDNDVLEATHIADHFAERFPFLKPAVEAWRDMIPMGDFPGKPKATILEIQRDIRPHDFSQLFGEFQKRMPEYGLGDLQARRMCRELGIEH